MPYRDNAVEENGSGQQRRADDYSFNTNVNHSLPPLEQVLADNAMSKGKGGGVRMWNKKLVALVCLSFVSLAAVIGISVAIAGRNSSGGSSSSADFKWSNKESRRHRAIAEFLGQFAYTSMKRMSSQGTPQYEAIRWLAEEDPAELEIPDSIEYDNAMDLVQRFVLATFYFSTNGDSWNQQLRFLSSYDVCSWNESIDPTAEAEVENFDGWFSGVQCNEDGEVNYIFIPENNLSGELPPEFGLLLSVMHFSAFENRLTGSLPESLREWTDLKLFAVEANMMSGTLPSWMGEWTLMEYLAVGSNQFTGSLPNSVFSSMPFLREASLHDNDFSGSFDMFNENTALDTLLLHRNRFSGSLESDSFEDIPLRVLDMSYNEVSGRVPAHFYKFHYVSLHHNKISGMAEPEGSGNHIRFLSLYSNQLAGEIPENIGDLDWLTHLDLSDNRLQGAIPDSINSCTDLVYLYLGNNNFAPNSFPNLVDLTNLEELSVRNMGITGTLPGFIGALLRRLVLLDVRDNDMDGSLPSNLHHLVSMEFFLLSDNKFSGALPSTLWQMHRLKVLGVDGNDLMEVEAVCRSDGPDELDWFAADAGLQCECCTDQCLPGDNACGGSSLISPNIEGGYKRSRFIFSPELIYDASVKTNV